jgi:hypothetical protein
MLVLDHLDAPLRPKVERNVHADNHPTTTLVVRLHRSLFEVLVKLLYHLKPLFSTRALYLREVRAWLLSSLGWIIPRRRLGAGTQIDHRQWDQMQIEVGLDLDQIVHFWIGDRVPSTTMGARAYLDQAQDHLFLRKAVQPSGLPTRQDCHMILITTSTRHP